VHNVRSLLQATLATMQGASRALRDSTRVGTTMSTQTDRVEQQTNGEK
jgi:hypothetical protein